MKLEVSVYTFVSRAAIKYLRVIIDAKLNFIEHLEYACQKAGSGIKVLAKQ